MSAAPKNVILLTMDALRADHLSSYGYKRDTSPNIDDLAENGLLFTQAYSASSHTREAIPAILTGNFPDEAINLNYHRSSDTISTYMNKEGFKTAGFHSNPFVSRAYGFDKCFDKFDDDLHLGKHKLIALAQRALDKLRNRHYARANEINKRSISWIDSLETKDQFFLWNHYMDPHGPYEPFDDYRAHYHGEKVDDKHAQRLYKRAIKSPESITEDETKLLIDLYDAEIRYTDEQVGVFINKLDQRDILEETLIVITADHGDAFGERGYYEHPRYIHEELTQVPMILYNPNLDAKSIKTPVSTIDIVPTILDSIGKQSDLPGQSLFDVIKESDKNRTVFMQARGENKNKQIRRFGARNIDEIAYASYDIDQRKIVMKEYDDAELFRELKNHIEDRIGKDNESVDNGEEEANEEINQRLAALGYRE